MKQTSIQYQLTNVVLFYEVFTNWNNFNELLNKGPEAVKKFLFNKWIYLKEELSKDKELEIKDFNKEITIDDFDITLNKTKDGVKVLYITFPDYEFNDGTSKYIALALTEKSPRYFTLEYSENIVNKEQYWIIGEFKLNNGEKTHYNIGKSDNMRIEWFAGYILGLLES